MSTLKNKSKSELIEEIESLEMQLREFKRNENILSGSEEKFTKTFNSSPSSMIISEIDSGKIIDVNNGFANMVMYSKHELIGKNVFELNLWVNIKDREKYIKKMKDDKNVTNLEIELRTKSGDIRVTLISGEIIKINGKPHLLTSGTDITERKRGEEALLESEEKFRRLAENSPDIIYRHRLQPNHGFEYISPAITKISGYKPEEHYNDPELGLRIIHPEDKPELDKFATGKYSNVTHVSRWIHKDGTIIWIEDKHSPVYDADNNLIAVEGVARNITERKNAEVALQQSETKFRTLFETMVQGVVYQDKNGKIISANPAAEKALGLTIAQMQGRSSMDPRWKAIHEDGSDYPGNTHPSMIALETGEQVSNVIMGIFNPSLEEYRWLNVHAIPEFKKGESKPYQVYSTFEDITVRKLAEVALKEQSYRNEQILETTLDGYILADSDGKIIDVNPAYCEMIGYSWEELLKMNIRDVEVKTPPEEVDRRIQQMVRMGGDHFETKHKHKDGHILELDTSTSIMYLDEAPLVAAFVRDITKSNLAEIALHQSEERFQRFAHAASEGIGIVVDGIIEDTNNRLVELTGYSREELIGDPLMKIVFPDDQRLVAANIKKGSESPIEFRILRRDGSIIFVEARGANINYGEKNARIAGIYDITERKVAEETLRESEKKFREMADLSPLIFYEIDINRNLTFFNKRASSVFGFSEHDLMSNFSALDRVIPEDRDRARENMKKIMNGKPVRNTEYTLIKKDGSTFPVLIYSNSVMKDNKPVGLRGVIIDVTERKLAEKAVRESEERLSKFINSAENSYHILDANFKILEINRAALEALYMASPNIKSKEDVVGQNFEQIYPFTKKEIPHFYKVLETGKKYESVLTVTHPKLGELFLSYICFKVGNGIGIIVENTTERMNAEKKLKDSHNQLRSLAERLQMIREEERATVAREIHDDLGQTLTALKMDITWMKKNPGMTEESRISKINTMLGLTDSTIQTVKRIATELRPGILDDLGLVSAIEWQTKEFQNRSGIECAFEIFVDEFAIEEEISIAVFRIFQESLTNIARHSGANKVEVTLNNKGDFIRMEITDNGIGINEEQITSSKSLGLIGMNERVSVFGGNLTISRAAKGGTTVRVYVPIKKIK